MQFYYERVQFYCEFVQFYHEFVQFYCELVPGCCRRVPSVLGSYLDPISDKLLINSLALACAVCPAIPNNYFT